MTRRRSLLSNCERCAYAHAGGKQLLLSSFLCRKIGIIGWTEGFDSFHSGGVGIYPVYRDLCIAAAVENNQIKCVKTFKNSFLEKSLQKQLSPIDSGNLLRCLYGAVDNLRMVILLAKWYGNRIYDNDADHINVWSKLFEAASTGRSLGSTLR